MLEELEITPQVRAGHLLLLLRYPQRTDLGLNFRLTLQLYTQQLPTLLYRPLSTQLLLFPTAHLQLNLRPGCMHKLECAGNILGQHFKKTIFVFANQGEGEGEGEGVSDPRENIRKYFEEYKSDVEHVAKRQCLSQSEMLLKVAGEGSNRKKERLILAARKCKNTEQFLNPRDRVHNHKEFASKQDLLLKGLILFDEVYSRRPGSTFFKNDWHMGPFYSYDSNEATLHKN